MKKLIQFIAISLSAVFLLTVVACTAGNEQSSPSDTSSADFSSMRKYDTTHDYDVTDGTVDLVKDGESDFVIVYPASQAEQENISNAVNELKTFFYQATGVQLSSFPDSVKTDAVNILSVGKTEQFKAATSVVQKLEAAEVGTNGYIIETVDSAVYMVGDYSYGTMYAVYEWLEWQFGFKFYAPDEVAIDTGIKNAKLKIMHITDIPDFETRIYGYGMARPSINGRTISNRYRVVDFADGFNTTGIQFCHNTFDFFPRSEYAEEHSNWYSNTGAQMCLTRDPDGIAKALLPKLQEKLLAQPEINIISFSARDGGNGCTCESCMADVDKYDRQDVVYSAAAIKLLNKVAKGLKEWNEEVCPERKIYLTTFAYGQERYAPVKVDENKQPIVDENGNYLPYSDEFILEDNIAVMFCHGGASGYWNIGEHESTMGELEQVKRWQALGATFITWVYGTYFDDHWLPMNTIERYQKIYEFDYNLGSVLSIENAENNATDSTDWGTLKAYLDSTLRWDFQQDLETLINDFMDAYYKEAAPAMKKFLSAYRSYTAYLATVKGVDFQVNSANLDKTKENWPYMKIREFLDYCDEAYALIEPLKATDPKRYETLYNRIQKEECSYLYLEYDLYPDVYEYSYLQTYRQELYNIFTSLKLRKGEYVTTASYFGY